MYQVMKSIDQANGYVFGGVEEDNRGNFSQLMSSAVGTDFENILYSGILVFVATAF